jgi:hypothetical protein
VATDSVELQSGVDTVILTRKTPGLRRRIEHMSEHDLDDYFATLAWKKGGYNSNAVNATCKHRSTGLDCTGSDSAHVIIQPEAGMHKRSFSDVPDSGMIVARIINDAPLDLDEKVFGYPAQDTTYWVVEPSGGRPQSRFFVRTHSATPIRFVSDSLPYRDCNHFAINFQARAKFWTCPDSYMHRLETSARDEKHPGPTVGALESYIHPVSLRGTVPPPSASAPSPLMQLQSNWVSCGNGCCATM